VLALALHLTGSAADADDITQDVFLRVFQSLGDFEHRCAFYTWIYRISLNRSLQVLQKRRVRRGVDLDDPRVAIAVAIDAHDTPHRALELRETYAQLVFAFDQLSPLLRTTVVLTTLQGLSHGEVAAIFGTTEGTIAWRMHEARDQLRRALAVFAQPVEAVQTTQRLRAVTGTQRTPRASRARSDDGAADTSSGALALALIAVVYA
jgi:RNA polymerase sigma-70 factor (ECF subfamily)